jgi:hypothetical protein
VPTDVVSAEGTPQRIGPEHRSGRTEYPIRETIFESILGQPYPRIEEPEHLAASTMLFITYCERASATHHRGERHAIVAGIKLAGGAINWRRKRQASAVANRERIGVQL